jgi:hypothetical protein
MPGTSDFTVLSGLLHPLAAFLMLVAGNACIAAARRRRARPHE